MDGWAIRPVRQVVQGLWLLAPDRVTDFRGPRQLNDGRSTGLGDQVLGDSFTAS